jgi:hypothetical protein
MALLFSLQENLSNAVAQDKWTQVSFDFLTTSKAVFTADWASYIVLLQHCHTYVRDYLFLCEYVVTRPASECIAFGEGLLHMGEAICEEVSRLLVKHERTYHNIRSYTSVIPQSSTVATAEGSQINNGES